MGNKHSKSNENKFKDATKENKKDSSMTLHNIDFTKFEETKEKCNTQNKEIEMVKNCSSLLRIAYGLKYYELLSKDNDRNNVFVEFIQTIYHLYLSDYIHLVTKHSSTTDLNKINKELLNIYNFNTNKCNSQLTQCIWTQWHYRTNRNKRDQKHTKNESNFYVNLFATIHFYLFHLESAGLRCFKDINNDKPMDINAVDEYFNEIEKAIEIKRKQYDKTGITNERLNTETSKFNIMTINSNDADSKENEGDNTFIDNMLMHIKSNKKLTKKLGAFIEAEEFDSDGIIEDINNGYGNIPNENDIMSTFIKQYTISNTKFSTGLVFFYWIWYKTCNEEAFKNAQGSVNQTDFSGYSISSLCVDKHYSSVAEEALEIGSISTVQFKEKVVGKAAIYLQSDACKEMKCVEKEDALHFGIDKGEPLKPQHLQSLLLYTDFTKFCTVFSESFRALKWNEELELIKKRNSKFFHISKYLNEIICYYGISGIENKAYGPFYCGLSCGLNIGSYAIRLNGPTSTTKQIAVAGRFSTRKGMIIQLNNKANKYAGQKERYFDTSFISGYPEEDERLYIRGRYKVEINSIRLYDKKESQWKNYERYFHSFYLLDSLLSGDWPFGTKVTKTDVSILSRCICNIFGTKENGFDAYVNDCFYLFTRQKKQIILNLREMDYAVKNKSFVDLIMHKVVGKDKRYDGDSLDNVFKKELLKLFPQTQQIIIYSSSTALSVYPLNVFNLLDIICGASRKINKIIIKDRADDDYKWLFSYFSKFATRIKQKYTEKKLSIELKREQGKDKYEDWLIISA